MKQPIALEILAHLPSTAVVRRADGVAETYLKKQLVVPGVEEFSTLKMLGQSMTARLPTNHELEIMANKHFAAASEEAKTSRHSTEQIIARMEATAKA